MYEYPRCSLAIRIIFMLWLPEDAILLSTEKMALD